MASKYECKFDDTYSGTEDLDLFLNRFETYAKLRDFATDKKVLALGLRLKGPAAVCFSGLSDSDKNDFSKVVTTLKQVFEGDSARWVREAKLAERSQGDSESIDSYVTDILQWSRQLKCSENEQVGRFVRGLKPALRAFVISKQPKSMVEAIDFARLGETIDKISNPTTTNVVNANSDDKLAKIEGNVSKIQSQLSQIEKKVKSVQKYNKGPGQSNYKRSYQFNKQRVPTSKNVKFDGICHRCGKYGHRKAECFSKFHIDGHALN